VTIRQFERGASEPRRAILSALRRTLEQAGVRFHRREQGRWTRCPTAGGPAMTASCPWCGRRFKPRTSGGTEQRFCGAGCRHSFWSAARRWAMRAVETGLLSADMLRTAQSSVHAVPAGVGAGQSVEV
jgi:hypothetical protein